MGKWLKCVSRYCDIVCEAVRPRACVCVCVCVMVRYTIPLGAHHLHPLISIVAAHGVTDLDTWRWLPRYALCAFAPASPVVVTTTFSAASVVHFARDVGVDGSVALHSLVGMATLLFGTRVGMWLMLNYLVFVHVPLHYLRCFRGGRRAALVVAALATVAAIVGTRGKSAVVLSDFAQRVVVAHCWTENSIGAEADA